MTPSAEEKSQLRDACKELCRRGAERLMRRYRRLERYEKKGAKDLVTIADRESEDAVIACIREQFPDHAILAEESGQSTNSESE